MSCQRADMKYKPTNIYCFYTKHHLKFGKNQADNLAYIGFRRRFFPVFYWCLVLVTYPIAVHTLSAVVLY